MSKNTTKKAKRTRQPKKGYDICPDCGVEYLSGGPHMMFCPAHTCEECGTSFDHVLEKNNEGRRICEACEFHEQS